MPGPNKDALPDRILLRAGPLTMMFEPAGAFLRYVRFGDHEVLRGIYAAVRDHNWDTVPPCVTNLSLDASEDAFELGFDVTAQEGAVDYFWHGRVTGASDGTVRFEMDGEARSTFLRNRIGFCVLHPVPECAGRPCIMQKQDGTEQTGTFPRLISPHQPFMDMRAISHEVIPGLWAEVAFEGDVFETEDQRNWTDASFKTYCTPLHLPFPVEVQAGTTLHQAVTLRLPGDPRPAAPPTQEQPDEVILHVQTREAGRLPALGLGLASHGQPLTARQQSRLAALHLAHLRVDLHLADEGYERLLAQATEEAGRLGTSLEAAVFLTDQAPTQLERLRRALEAIRPKIVRVLVFHEDEKSTAEHWVRLARSVLSNYDAEMPFGGGTNAYFAELNRERPPADALDVVCYSINPQVHAFDDASLVETLGTQGVTVASARHIVPGPAVAVTPVTLKPRFNPNATGPEPDPPPGALPPQVDPRQPTRFAAAWTLGSLKHLAEQRADSVTYYETTGWRGVMETEQGPPLPEAFPSRPDAVFPLYHVLADVGACAGARVHRVTSSHPLLVEGLALAEGSNRRVLVANYTAAEQPVRLRFERPLAGAYIRVLDETNEAEAAHQPERFQGEITRERAGPVEALDLRLPPHAYARIDEKPQ